MTLLFVFLGIFSRFLRISLAVYWLFQKMYGHQSNQIFFKNLRLIELSYVIKRGKVLGEFCLKFKERLVEVC